MAKTALVRQPYSVAVPSTGGRLGYRVRTPSSQEGGQGSRKKQYITINKDERNSFRKEIIGKLEEQLAKNNCPEDDLFYYHPSEDKIVLSHALFWVMPQNIKGKVGKEMYLFLLRQYQEEILEAYTISVSA